MRADALPAEQVTSQKSATSHGIRSFVVTLGPSLIADGVMAASAAVTLSQLRRSHSGWLRGGLGQPLALLGAVAPWIYLLCVRQWVLHWGATDAEVRDVLPGDELVSRPVWQSTRAIDIAAPVSAVWPWLAQMGENRGGLYSYDWLENIAGLEFHSAQRIVPEWQAVNVGDFVQFAPEQDTLVVARVEPEHCLVWRMLKPGTHDVADLSSSGVVTDASWAFVLRATDTEHTRLIQRFRFGSQPRVLGALYTALMEIPHFVMERKMLLGIRQRAERVRLETAPSPREPRQVQCSEPA
jgi:hypothetical protein